MPFFGKLVQTTPPTLPPGSRPGRKTNNEMWPKGETRKLQALSHFRYLSMDHWVAQECHRGCIMAIITQRLGT